MKRTGVLIGVLMFSGACLWLSFREAAFGEVLEEIGLRRSAWPFFLLSGLVMMANILFRGFRFHCILSAYPQVGLRPAITMTGMMFLGNSILPFRAGEAVRVFLPFKLFDIPIASSLALHGADRLFDFAGLLGLLALSLLFAGDSIAPEARSKPFEFFGGEYTFDGLIRMSQTSSLAFLGVGLAGIVLLSLFPQQIEGVIRGVTRPLGEKWSGRLTGMVDHLYRGISVFRTPKDLVWGAFWTIMLWWMVILNVQILGSVFEVTLTWAQAGIIVLIVAVAVSLPQAPGYVGPFQLAFAMGLSLCFGVSQSVAAAVAWLAWFFQIFPVILFGFLCLFVEGLSLASFAEAQQTLEQAE